MTNAATDTLQRLDHILRSMRVSEYTHKTEVDEAKGIYRLDCSALVDWVLKLSAPQAYEAVLRQTAHKRPLAEDYVAVMGDTRSNGWNPLTRVDELQPGDVIAWTMPADINSTNTGHVMFVFEKPQAIGVGRHSIRVADSSSSTHAADSRDDHASIGTGVIVLVTEHERPVAYGWKGRDSKRFYRTHIVLGRPVS